jgi:hypothetical protein
MQTKGNCQVITLASSAARPRRIFRYGNGQMAPRTNEDVVTGDDIGLSDYTPIDVPNTSPIDAPPRLLSDRGRAEPQMTVVYDRG